MTVYNRLFHIYSSTRANFSCLQNVIPNYLPQVGRLTSVGMSRIVGETILDNRIECIVSRQIVGPHGAPAVMSHVIVPVDALSQIQSILAEKQGAVILDLVKRQLSFD